MKRIGLLLTLLALTLSARASCPFSRGNANEESDSNENINNLTTKDLADPETTTPNNCKCTTICSCGVGCDPGLPIPLGETKDWCNTADKCGEWSLTSGYWDYCLYKDSSKPDYLAMTWQEKTNEIMEQVLAEPSPGTFPNVAFIATESIVTSFDDEWDVMPVGRQKYIHGVGAVCKFTLDIKDSPYTGMFKNGLQTGIIRIGPALDIANGAGVPPGAGVKFLRTGQVSGNFVALRSLTAGENYNIFDPDLYHLYNHILGASNPQELILVNKFLQGSSCPKKVGLSDIARYDQDGNEEEPIFPFKVTLKPTGAVSFREEESPILDFMQQFIDNIPAGTELYSFMAHANPDDVEGTELAKMVVPDGCFPSKYGDEHLFFQHQRIEEDIELRPEWESAYMTECT